MKKGLKNNIRFNYLYRDAGNYKKCGFVIFRNPENLSVNKITTEIRKNLIDGSYFYPKSIRVPLLSFKKYNKELDHLWNEFESVEISNMSHNDNRTIVQFIKDLSKIKTEAVSVSLKNFDSRIVLEIIKNFKNLSRMSKVKLSSWER